MKLLGGIREGDKVRFVADRINGAITMKAIEASWIHCDWS